MNLPSFIFYLLSCLSDYETSESSFEEDYYNMDSGYPLPSSEMEDGAEEQINEYWQPIINMKLDDQGQVLLQGSSIQLFRYENDRLVCIQKYDDVLFISENSPILEATQWWSFHIPNTNPEERTTEDRAEEINPCFSDSISFQFGIGDIQMESLSVWDNIQWGDLDSLQPNEIEYSSFIEINTGQYWTYGIGIKDSQWLLLRPSYRFPI